jgi:hypothetical protein
MAGLRPAPAAAIRLAIGISFPVMRGLLNQAVCRF